MVRPHRRNDCVPRKGWGALARMAASGGAEEGRSFKRHNSRFTIYDAVERAVFSAWMQHAKERCARARCAVASRCADVRTSLAACERAREPGRLPSFRARPAPARHPHAYHRTRWRPGLMEPVSFGALLAASTLRRGHHARCEHSDDTAPAQCGHPAGRCARPTGAARVPAGVVRLHRRDGPKRGGRRRR